MATAKEIETMTVGQNLKVLRRAAGMTQQQLAARSGLPQGRISQYENDEAEMLTATVIKFAHALGVRAADFFEGVA